MAGPRRTSALPLALTYALLIVYASLYPFQGWRDQGIAPWAFLSAPLPAYWTGFDVLSNVVGYAPLGFLLGVAVLRGTRGRFALVGPVAIAGVLSLCLESLQAYLPTRVPSNVDFVLNLIGATFGACSAWLLEHSGLLDRWSRFRSRWFAVDARGVLVLLALWPVALLFPAVVPFGLGQVYERLDAALAQQLAGTPFLNWLPLRETELQPLLPGVELVCVALGALIPCLLGFCVIGSRLRRLVFLVFIIGLGLAGTALSAALSFGPGHAWGWLTQPTQFGLVGAAALAVILSLLPPRVSAALALMALMLHLSLINQAPASPYFAQTLQTWEQGRFIRFNGLAQWVGWVWPYAALLVTLARLSRGQADVPRHSRR